MKLILAEMSLVTFFLVFSLASAKPNRAHSTDQVDVIDLKPNTEDILMESLRYFVSKGDYRKSVEILTLIEALKSNKLGNINLEQFTDLSKYDQETNLSGEDANKNVNKRRTFFVGK